MRDSGQTLKKLVLGQRDRKLATGAELTACKIPSP